MKKTAIVLLGFQNDFFSPEGILHEGVKEHLLANQVLENTLRFLNEISDSDTLIVTTPICFADAHKELGNACGLMASIRDLGAFRSDSFGGKIIPELEPFEERIVKVHGKAGFNAFHNTELDRLLKENQVEEIVILGVVTSVCIDSTGRAASEKGFGVTILSDCTASRSEMEHSFYCSDIFPLYANVEASTEFLAKYRESSAALVS